jgi:hypothetical protein
MDTPIQPTRSTSADSLDGAVWRRSRYSGTQGNCVEVAANLPALVAVRDSKDPDGPRLVVSAEGWRGFIRTLRETA